MKTKVEIEGYEIEIQFEGGVISVKAEIDDEVVEEFTIEVEEGQGEDSDDVKGFEDFDGEEEEDFDGEDLGGDDLEGDDLGDDDFEEETGALESFQSFIKKRK